MPAQDWQFEGWSLRVERMLVAPSVVGLVLGLTTR